MGIFMDEWKSLYDSKSGERGIFNRASAQKCFAKNGRRNTEHEFWNNLVQRSYYEIESFVIFQRL